MASTGDDESEPESLPFSSPTRLESPFDDDDARDNGSDIMLFTDENRKRKLSDSELDEEDFSSEDDSDERENRFVGPSSTWRFFTENERALAASLDQQRANDLSIHLYNAHKLKVHVRDSKSALKATSNQDGNPPWRPDEAWTAWPLKPEDVPRRKEQFGVPPISVKHDERTYTKPEAWRPSADLEEEIQALMLREANVQFQERRTEESPEAGEIDLLVDDEEAGAILGSGVRQVLANTNALFMGLHNDRQRCVHKNSRSRSRSTRSRSVASAKARAAMPPKTRSQSRRKASGGGIEDPESLYSEEESDNEASCGELSTQRLPSNIRNWKDVLNAASLAGWNQSAVERAVSRCASLFGETMTFKKLYNCPVADCKRHNRPWDRAWRWREHLRRTHKYSLKDVYKIEASLDGATREGESDQSSLKRSDDGSD